MKGINVQLKNWSKVVCLIGFIFLGQKVFSQSNVTINATSTTNGTWSGTTVGPYIFTPNAANATVINTDIQQRLLGTGGFTAGNVTIVTTCGACGQAGNVTIANPITAPTTAAARTFTITAAGSITVNAAINFTTANAATAAPGSNISLTSTGSSISIAAAITTTGGNSTGNFNAGAAGGSVTLSANTSVSVTAAITTSGGNGTAISANGGAGGAVSITSTTSTTSTAAGTITTTGGTSVGLLTGGTGGSVTIAAATNASIAGAITSRGGAGTSGNANGGNGSAVSITGATGITLTANLAADGGVRFGTGTVGTGGNYIFNDGAAAITTGGVNDGQTAGVISGSGTVTKNGSGTFNMDGANTYTGKTIISAGTISANTLRSVSGGSSSLGSPATVPNGTIDVGATGVLQYTGVAQTSDRVVNLTGSGGSIDASGSGLLTLTGGVTGNANNLVLKGTGTGSVSSVIATTTGGLTKNGTGTWTLSGANTYTGVTTINAGVVSVGSINNGGTAGNLGQAAVAASNLVLGGGTLQYTGATASTNRAFTLSAGTTSSIEVTTGANTLTISGSVPASTGDLTKLGAGTLLLSGTNLYTGKTTVSAGTLKAGSTQAFGNGSAVIMANTAGAILDITGFNNTIGSLTGGGATGGDIILGAATLTIGSNNTSPAAYAGEISGTGLITKSGTGKLTLSGTNTYTGATNVSGGGVLNIQNNSGLGTTAAGTTVASGSALELQGNIIVGAEALSLTGTGVASNGALRHISGANTYGGAITLGGATTIQSDTGTLILTNAATITGAAQNLVLEGAGNGIVSSIIATTTGTITKNDAGTWSLTGTNTYSGAVTINGGILSVSSIANAATNSALGTGSTTPIITIAATGTLQYTGIGHSSSRVINLTGNGASVDASGSGTMTLTGGITGNTRNLVLTGSGVGVESGVIATTTGSVTKTGEGSWSLTGANTYTGGTVISEGMLSLGAAGVLADGGKVTLNGGTLGTLTFAETMGALVLTDSSTIELGPTSTLNFAASNGETWTAGKKITINGWKGVYTGTGTTGTGSKIFVGSATTALTAAQLAQIQFFNAGNYYPATILATGEIVPRCVVTVTSASSSSVTTGVANNVNYTITGASTSYTWSRAAVTGISNTASSAQTSNPIVETLTNTTTSAINVTYVITTTAGGGCLAGTFKFVVSVNPVNTATCNAVPAAPPQPACGTLSSLTSGATTTLTASTSYGFCGTSFSTGNIDGGSTSPIYVLSGQTLTIAGNVNTASTIYVFAGATLNLTGDYNTTGSNMYVYGTLNHALGSTAKLQGNPSIIWIAPGAEYNAGDLEMNATGTLINEGSVKLNSLSQFQGSAKMCVHNSGCVSTGTLGTVNATNIITFGGSKGYFYYSGTTCPTQNNVLTTSTDMRICASISTATAAASPGSNCSGKFGSAQVTYGCTPSYINCTGAIALPVTLTFFKPTLTNEGVVIKWGTNSQWDSHYFIIEKSKKGIDWEYVGTLSSENEKYRYKEYSVTDPNPYEGDSYYRLVEVDINGKRTVYATDFIHNDKKFAGFSIYPNPSNGNFIVSISGDSPQYQLNLFDVLGKNLGVYTLLAGKNEITTGLSAGVYLAKLKVGPEYFTQKIVIK